jgi:hypothetical protein
MVGCGFRKHCWHDTGTLKCASSAHWFPAVNHLRTDKTTSSASQSVSIKQRLNGGKKKVPQLG